MRAYAQTVRAKLTAMFFCSVFMLRVRDVFTYISCYIAGRMSSEISTHLCQKLHQVTRLFQVYLIDET